MNHAGKGGREGDEDYSQPAGSGGSGYLPGLGPGSRPAAPRAPRPVRGAVPVSREPLYKKLAHYGLPCAGLFLFVGCLASLILSDQEMPPAHPAAPPVAEAPTIILDAGHGGIDEGASARGLLEKDLTLDVALRVEPLVRSAGFPTVLTRRSDLFVSLADRVEIANHWSDALFVSIHFNQSPQSPVTGIETFYADQKMPAGYARFLLGLFAPRLPAADTGENLAAYIQATVVSKLDAVNRGIKSRSLYVVRNTRCPAVLVEGGFISNGPEAQLLGNPEYRQRLAGAIADGIVAYEHSRGAPLSPLTFAKLKDVPRPADKTSE